MVIGGWQQVILVSRSLVKVEDIYETTTKKFRMWTVSRPPVESCFMM